VGILAFISNSIEEKGGVAKQLRLAAWQTADLPGSHIWLGTLRCDDDFSGADSDLTLQ
jgi:hypothetical protein